MKILGKENKKRHAKAAKKNKNRKQDAMEYSNENTVKRANQIAKAVESQLDNESNSKKKEKKAAAKRKAAGKKVAR